MDRTEWLAEWFEEQRPRLQAVAYRMLGSVAEADDAVQDAWLRLSGSEDDQISNLAGWLTTVVARECLHTLRSRRHRREDLGGAHLPDQVIIAGEDLNPEQQALLADSVGVALLVVLDTLTPAQRLAFVLHDMFDVPFDEIAHMIDCTPAAARQLASRARRRVQGVESPRADIGRQREVVEAFFSAARAGDFDSLLKVLDPDIVLLVDAGPGRPPVVYRGVAEVAKRARAPRGAEAYPVLVNGRVGVLVTRHGRPFSIMAFSVVGHKITEINGIHPDRVRQLAAVPLDTEQPDMAEPRQHPYKEA
jgi:RNA polymerase sigma factor (sigma-70 family)